VDGFVVEVAGFEVVEAYLVGQAAVLCLSVNCACKGHTRRSLRRALYRCELEQEAGRAVRHVVHLWIDEVEHVLVVGEEGLLVGLMEVTVGYHEALLASELIMARQQQYYYQCLLFSYAILELPCDQPQVQCPYRSHPHSRSRPQYDRLFLMTAPLSETAAPVWAEVAVADDRLLMMLGFLWGMKTCVGLVYRTTAHLCRSTSSACSVAC
jgi:hypothetical protein